MLPPLALQLTLWLGPPTPETEAANPVDSPALRAIVEGLTLTPVTTEFTVTVVLATLLASAADVAVTVNVPAVVAVNRPLPLMLPPPLTHQFTPVFTAPLTLAENWTLLPAFTDGPWGLIDEIEAGVTVMVRVAVAVPVLFW
ncbi:hypothetical protein [Geothrix sp. 21YS21S-4]|uniref:hypothetical protein n=1 Tax=Geothrix sp. 21YS21S-4 TaxID=3068889 RepID=UPI0027BA9B55|nr:hypothetical protein [Geothrix sp. 21YS21S-4]